MKLQGGALNCLHTTAHYFKLPSYSQTACCAHAQEALVLARAVHPNVVACYGGSLQPSPPSADPTASSSLFFVMEQCATSLRDLL